MIPRTAVRLFRGSRTSQKPAIAGALSHRRPFSSTPHRRASNRIYTPSVQHIHPHATARSFPLTSSSVRRPDDFATYLLLSTSSRAPLLTLWTASYCNTCKQVSPVLNDLVSAGVGEEEGGVSFCEVEFDSPDILSSDLGMTYLLTSMPTLLSFDRGEAQLQTKVTDPKKMTDREWLKEWIRTEARRKGSGGGGGGGGGGFFGGLFGSTR
jgi:thiol-disulfide isomerase/thioredoxin